MNLELKEALDEYKKRKPHLEIYKTPDVFIDRSSSSKEVTYWLREKGFDKRYTFQSFER